MKASSCLAALALYALSQASNAADGSAEIPLCVTNAGGIALTLHPRRSRPFDVGQEDGAYRVWISGREQLRIKACSFNPVLYTYSAGEQTTTPLPDVAAANQFASAIKDVIAILASANVTTASPGGGQTSKHVMLATKDVSKCNAPQSLAIQSIDGIDLHDLSTQISDLIDLFESIPRRIEETHNPKNPSLPRSQEDFATRLAGVRQIQETLAAVSKHAIGRLSRRAMLIEISAPAALRQAYRSVEEVRARTEEVNGGCASTYVEQLEGQLGALDYAARERTTLASMLETAEAFGVAFARVGGEHNLATVRFTSQTSTSQPINVGQNSTFEKLFSDSTMNYLTANKDKGSGQVTVVVEPELSLRLAIAPGVIYSFVKQPKFSAPPDENGTFTITRDQADYAAASGVLALNITHDRYMYDNVRPFIQVGISPKKDELAFLLGAGFALPNFNNAVLSFGAIYQERDQLIEGQSVGDTLASADDLKVDPEFKVGFYVGLAYNLSAD